MVDSKISSFEDLKAWQEAQNLAVSVYALAKSFPKEEIFGLTSQLKRAVASVSANTAEGFGRRTLKDKLQFYTIAYGSLLETKNFLYLANKLTYLEQKDLNALLDQTVICQKLLNALMRSLNNHV